MLDPVKMSIVLGAALCCACVPRVSSSSSGGTGTPEGSSAGGTSAPSSEATTRSSSRGAVSQASSSPTSSSSSSFQTPASTSTAASSAGTSGTSENGARLLFKSGFEGATTLEPASQGWMKIVGTDATTGYSWPITAWGGLTDPSGFQLLTSEYDIQIQTVTGHAGAPTRALFQSMNNAGANSIAQIPLVWEPTNALAQQGDLYTSEWVKFQPDLATQLVPGEMPDGGWGNWRSVFEWKTGGQGAQWDGDFRTALFVIMNSNGRLGWKGEWRNGGGSPDPATIFWTQDNFTVDVPVGEWFQLETLSQRGTGTTGRFWAKINGVTIFDHAGNNLDPGNPAPYCHGPCPINRVFFIVYTGAHTPAYQWTDDLELWEGAP